MYSTPFFGGMYGVFFQKFLGMQPAMATQFYKWSDDWAMKRTVQLCDNLETSI